ncbi:response regulator transcription factor [Clostridium intestinale]|uniref:response regulator transcription factor n=1 Tax=Clostridium intestinale TaxID=36845 RepID=UPI0028EE5A93|nr:response regulator transcription factor [Clostridium intestinale]
MVDVLLIEDNIEMGEVLCDFLEAQGFSCYHADSGEKGVDFILKNKSKIILLDIMLPGIDGFEVCRVIREKMNVPIIIISAKTGKEDKINGLIIGADDYIEKPFDMDILIAKIKAIYRRNYEKPSIICIGDIVIDIKSRIVKKDEQKLILTSKEYELLLYLIENKGKTLRKEQIFNKIWGMDSFSELSTLTVHVKWLREKIEKDPKNPRHITTVWGVGYRFEEEIQ